MAGPDGATTRRRSLSRRVTAPFAATRDALAVPALRRLQLAWLASTSGEYISVVGFGLVAYQAGGAVAVGLVGVVQMVPAALLNPAMSVLGDRYRRERVVAACDLARAAAMVGAAVAVAWDAPVVVLYLLAALFAVASAGLYPAQAGLSPLLARRRPT